MRRSYQLEPTGLEVFFSGRSSLFLTFATTAERDLYEETLRRQPDLRLLQMRSPRRRDLLFKRIMHEKCGIKCAVH